MFSPLAESMFIAPICYHPTTVLCVDDDKAFLQFLSLKLEKNFPLLCFVSPEDALDYTKNKHHYLPFYSRALKDESKGIKLNFSSIRNEIYNSNRFQEIFIVVTDYDMSGISGLELIKSLCFTPEISQYTHIILTGKASDEFIKKVEQLKLSNGYIRKDDPDYVTKIISFVQERTERIFQWYSYVPARILSNNNREKSTQLFDGDFFPIINTHIINHNIVEFYLFDQQGSYLFLDRHGKLSWLFVRNEYGMKNSIEAASRYGAPKKILDALQSKNYLLSLYENQDFESRKEINWEDYLLPATCFESNAASLSAFPNLITNTSSSGNPFPKYYYSFTDTFPENGIEKSKIVSYQDYLDTLE